MESTFSDAGAGRISVDQTGGVVTAYFDHPERRNALTWSMYDELEQLCQRVDREHDVRMLILRGAGGEAFASGTDIRQFTEFETSADGLAYEHRLERVLEQIEGIRVPVVGVVQGPAVGAGLAIASLCDVLIATPDAVFGAPIARTLGNCLHPTVIARLRSRLGRSHIMSLLLTSNLMDANAAQAAGLVYEVVTREALDERVAALVHRISYSAPLTLKGLKEIDRRLERSGMQARADDILEACYGSRDFQEGVQAFLEGRQPDWQGR